MSANLLATLLVFFFGLAACLPKSDDDDSVVTQAPAAESDNQSPKNVTIFSKASELPKCSDSYLNTIVYVEEDQSFYKCTGDKWSVAALPQEEPLDKVVISSASSWRKVWSKYVEGTCYIETKHSGTCTRFSSGSCFIVGENLVATNGHVVEKEYDTEGLCGTLSLESVRVWFPVDDKGDTQHDVRGSDATATRLDLSIATTDDLALVEVTTSGRPVLELSSLDEAEDHLSGDGVKLGDEVILMGYSGGTTFAHFSVGNINGIQKTSNANGNSFLTNLVDSGVISSGKTVFEYDLVSGGGASGGPLLDIAGKVIGVNFAGNVASTDTEFGFAVRIQPLRDFIAADRSWESIP